jgi:hypothetical protein
MRTAVHLPVAVAKGRGGDTRNPTRSELKSRSPNVLRCLLLVPALAVLSAAAPPAHADPNAAEDAPPAKGFMDDNALKVLRDMSAYLTTCRTLRFGVTILYDQVMESGILVKRSEHGEITLERPDKFLAVVTRDDQEQRRIYFDGTSLVRLVVDENAYQKIDFTGDTDSLLRHVIDKYNIQVPMADFLFNDLAATFQEYLISAEYMGIRTVDGVPCHHLSFESTGADWQLWVEVGDKPVPHMFAITFVNDEHSPQLVAMFHQWRVNPHVDEQLFCFHAPPGAQEVKITRVASAAGTD